MIIVKENSLLRLTGWNATAHFMIILVYTIRFLHLCHFSVSWSNFNSKHVSKTKYHFALALGIALFTEDYQFLIHWLTKHTCPHLPGLLTEIADGLKKSEKVPVSSWISVTKSFIAHIWMQFVLVSQMAGRRAVRFQNSIRIPNREWKLHGYHDQAWPAINFMPIYF